MRYIVQGTVTPLTTTVVPPPQDTIDKWGPVFNRPIHTKPPARPFFAQARTITFTELFPKDWQNDPFFQVPRRDPRYPWGRGSAQLARTEFAETTTPDKWRGPQLKTPVALRKQVPDSNNLNQVVAPPAENITSDKWTPPLAEVRRTVYRPTRSSIDFVNLVSPEIVTNDKWTPPLAEVRRQRNDIYYRGARTIGFIEEFITDVSLDKWRGNDIFERLRKVVYYNQARTIGFVEEFAPEGPITLDKWIGSQGDVRRRVPKPRGTAAIVQFNVPAAETVTSDKWLTAAGRLIRLRARPFFSNARTITFTDVTSPSGVGGFDQYASFVRIPFKQKWINRYRPVQYAVEIPEGPVTLDKWKGMDKLVRGPRYPLSNKNVIIPFFGPSAETITVDKWNAYINRVLNRAKRPTLDIYTPSNYPIVVAGETVTVDKWFDPKYRVMPSNKWFNPYHSIQFGLEIPEEILVDKWRGPSFQFQRPTVNRLRDSGRVLSTIGEIITLDKWRGSGSLMRGPRYPLFDRNIIIPFFGPSAEVLTLDKWIGSQGKIIRPYWRSLSKELTHYGLPATFAETISLDKWAGSQGRIIIPGKRSVSAELLSYGTQAVFIENVTFDKWAGSTGRIIRPLWRSLSKELAVLPQNILFGETATLDKWAGSQGRIIIPGKRSISAELSSYGVSDASLEILTLDKWTGSQGRVILPLRRSVSKELATLPQNITFNETAALDKWVGSQGRMIDTRRVVRRDPVYHLQIPIENVTFDKWFGSQGRIIIPLRRSASRELWVFGKPQQFNEIISIDKWESVWNHLVIRGPRPPLIVDLYGHTLIPRANAPTGRLEIYYVTAQSRVFQVIRRYGVDDDDRVYIVTPPQE